MGAAGFWCFWGIVGILPCFGVVKYGVLLGAFVGFQLVAIWNPNIWQLLHLVAGLFGVHVLVCWWIVGGLVFGGCWFLVVHVLVYVAWVILLVSRLLGCVG